MWLQQLSPSFKLKNIKKCLITSKICLKLNVLKTKHFLYFSYFVLNFGLISDGKEFESTRPLARQSRQQGERGLRTFPETGVSQKRIPRFCRKNRRKRKQPLGRRLSSACMDSTTNVHGLGEGVPPRKIYGGWAGVKKYLHFFSISL